MLEFLPSAGGLQRLVQCSRCFYAFVLSSSGLYRDLVLRELERTGEKVRLSPRVVCGVVGAGAIARYVCV